MKKNSVVKVGVCVNICNDKLLTLIRYPLKDVSKNICHNSILNYRNTYYMNSTLHPFVSNSSFKLLYYRLFSFRSFSTKSISQHLRDSNYFFSKQCHFHCMTKTTSIANLEKTRNVTSMTRIMMTMIPLMSCLKKLDNSRGQLTTTLVTGQFGLAIDDYSHFGMLSYVSAAFMIPVIIVC